MKEWRRNRCFRSLKDLLETIRGTPGRLALDLNVDNNAFGSHRIFEAVPHMIGKPILEGGIVNSAYSAMFSYYVQGETSENCAGFPSIVTPTSFNLARATAHLELFNVKHFIAKWKTTKNALRGSKDWRLLKENSGWELYEHLGHNGNYVFIPNSQPLPLDTKRWKEFALEWLYNTNLLGTPFILMPHDASHGPPVSEAAFRQLLFAPQLVDGDLCEWMHLGLFYYSPYEKNLIDIPAVDERKLTPTVLSVAGKRWTSIFGRPPFHMYKIHERNEHCLSYNATYIHSPDDRDAVLHYSNDDEARIWLNGDMVVNTGITGYGNFGQAHVRLKRGPNALLLKLAQGVGGHYFHAKLTDFSGAPFKDVLCSISSIRPVSVPQALPIDSRNCSISDEVISDNKIQFSTTGIGLPHIIKIGYFPNWKVRGAEKVYMVTPGFLMVYPTQAHVTLYYGNTMPDIAGKLLSGIAFMMFLGISLKRAKSLLFA